MYHGHSSRYALKFGYQYNNAFEHDINLSQTLNADTWNHIALVTRQFWQSVKICMLTGIKKVVQMQIGTSKDVTY